MTSSDTMPLMAKVLEVVAEVCQWMTYLATLVIFLVHLLEVVALEEVEETGLEKGLI